LADFDVKHFKAPFISPEEIRRHAESFRKQYWGEKSLPIDILSIVESDLRLAIRPIKNLRSECDTYALLLGTNKTIIVDFDNYMDERMQNRLRFSVAHEIGHLVLHKDLFLKVNHESIKEWQNFILNIPEREYGFIEYHANEFAGQLLVPVEPLRLQLKKAISHAKRQGLENENLIGDAALNYISSYICRFFGVSDQAIQKRLQKEKLWPPSIDNP
jgi:hypothetical protein